MIKKTSQQQPEYPMRINKYLAHNRYSTRRGADDMISRGLVKINGHVAVLGDKVNKDDRVEISSKFKKRDYVYFAYYKPFDIITHSPDGHEQSIEDVAGIKDVFPIGRLDKNSEGLIILTNDGRITDSLLNPEMEHEKEYLVKTQNKLRPSFTMHMEKGVDIEGYLTKPCKVTQVDDYTFKIVLTEGKKHQIRRMVVALHNEIAHLKRTRIMNVKIGTLKPNQWRKLEGTELKRFLGSLGMSE